MIVGDTSTWAAGFKSFDERLLERICALLPLCISSLGENPDEDSITLNLVEKFHQDKTVRRLFHHWEFQFEPTAINKNGARYSKGKIDLALFWDLNREKYLAYEAKRLNVTTKSGFSSLATPYVKEGVIRFVTEQYSEGLPVGCMLGYVLDGNTASIRLKVEEALIENEDLIALETGPSSIPDISTAARFESSHNRSNGSGHISIRHALVPCITNETQLLDFGN